MKSNSALCFPVPPHMGQTIFCSPPHAGQFSGCLPPYSIGHSITLEPSHSSHSTSCICSIFILCYGLLSRYRSTARTEVMMTAPVLAVLSIQGINIDGFLHDGHILSSHKSPPSVQLLHPGAMHLRILVLHNGHLMTFLLKLFFSRISFEVGCISFLHTGQ